jgi:hypothetical protein
LLEQTIIEGVGKEKTDEEWIEELMFKPTASDFSELKSALDIVILFGGPRKLTR